MAIILLVVWSGAGDGVLLLSVMKLFLQ